MRIVFAVGLILGCFMGAGFVSGREVACYFSQFGNVSYISCVLCGLLFFLLTMLFFAISKKVKSTGEFVSVYFRKNSRLIEWLFAICILILTGSMLAGTFSLAKSLNYNQFLIVLITILLVYFVVTNNIKGLSIVNTILVPFLILILMLTIKGGKTEINSCNNVLVSLLSGATYVFVNIVSLGLLIIEIGHRYSSRERFFISLICSIIITILLLGINYSIISNGLCNNVMPNLVLSNSNKILNIAMQICIYLGLFTTLISNVFLLSRFIFKYVSNRYLSTIIALILGLLISFFGFDNLVGYIYIFIGIVGVLIVFISIKKNKQI